ncbi:MAG: ATP-binding protein [Candidatus Aminicenantales bacterium]
MTGTLLEKPILFIASYSKFNVIIAGPTGTGKTYLACALVQAACRNGFSVRCFQVFRLPQKLTFARADGSSPKFLDRLAITQRLQVVREPMI